MLIDEVRTRNLVFRIACRLSGNPALQEDLVQEGMVHLWLQESSRPGQTASWYFQSVKFHLQNYISAGKSVDSLKRQSSKVTFTPDCPEIDEFIIDSNWDNETSFGTV